jgi:hypothetical protein
MLMRTAYEHEGNFYREWNWVGEHSADAAVKNILHAYLPKLPLSVPAIAMGKQGICVFWNESGDLVCLELIHQLLRELNTAALS